MRMRDYLIPFRTHRGEFAAFADSSGRQTVCRHSAVNTPRVWWCLVRDWCLIIQTPDTKFSFRAHACSRRYQTAFLVFLFVFCAKKMLGILELCISQLIIWEFVVRWYDHSVCLTQHWIVLLTNVSSVTAIIANPLFNSHLLWFAVWSSIFPVSSQCLTQKANFRPTLLHLAISCCDDIDICTLND